MRFRVIGFIGSSFSVWFGWVSIGIRWISINNWFTWY